MIKANELRIGNLLYYHGTTDVCTVYNIDKSGFDCETNLGKMSNGLYTPIPLTPEILECIKIKGKHFCDEFFIETNPSGVLIGHRPHGVKYLKHIKYVHQFQNLYFDLFEEELQINFQ